MSNGKKKLSVTDRLTDGLTDRQMDRVGHRVACTRLKKRKSFVVASLK